MTTEEIDMRIAIALEHILEKWNPAMHNEDTYDLRQAIQEEIDWLKS